jgi:glutathione S-transferase
MNIEASLPAVGERLWAQHEDLRNDVARIEWMWAEALAASGGPFLFGDFSAADAMFAPVCTRLKTYCLPVPAITQAYIQRITAAPGVAAWITDALAEKDFLDFEEPYRQHR